MTGPIIYVTALSIMCVSVIIVKWRQYNVQRALKLPKSAPHDMNDAYKSAKAVGLFLSQRAWATGVYLGMLDEYTGVPYDALQDIADGKDKSIIYLMRIAHNLGCEVIIRQVADYDTENPETTPARFKQLISRLNDNRITD